MEKQQLASIGSFCLNEACGDYKRVGLKNIVKCGKTETGVQRYRCKTCKKSFTETKGTMFYRCRHTPDEGPPAMSSDGKGAYRGETLETWGKVPEYSGRVASPKLPKTGEDRQYLQVIKKRKG